MQLREGRACPHAQVPSRINSSAFAGCGRKQKRVWCWGSSDGSTCSTPFNCRSISNTNSSVNIKLSCRARSCDADLATWVDSESLIAILRKVNVCTIPNNANVGWVINTIRKLNMSVGIAGVSNKTSNRISLRSCWCCRRIGYMQLFSRRADPDAHVATWVDSDFFWAISLE